MPPQGGHSSDAVVRDSAGITIVESTGPQWTDETRWIVDSVPQHVVRTPESRSAPFILHEIGDVVVLPDGRIVAENRGTNQLVVVDSTGSFLEVWGGTGEGPGEFTRMNRLFKCGGDTLMVQEVHRGTILDSHGNVIRTQPRRRDVSPPSRVIYEAASRDCSSTLWGWWTAEDIESPRRTRWDGYALAWVSPTGGIDTIGTFVRYELPDGLSDLPFRLLPDWTTDGERLFYGIGHRPEIEAIGRSGRLTRIIRWQAQAAPITEREWIEHEEGLVQAITYEPQWERARMDRSALPYDSLPLFGRGFFGGEDWIPALRLDDEGNLWVRQYAHVSMAKRLPENKYPVPAQRWWVFDLEGRLLGSLETPANVFIRTIVGDRIYAVSQDQFGAEEIQVYRIHKPMDRPRE